MAIRVVIAEDDPKIAEIQKRYLERINGFDLVGLAHGLAEAKDLVEVLQPELLLLDIQFPEGTGLELLRELRAKNSTTDVILITAAKEVAILKEALRGGVFDYILKPLVFDRLKEALSHFSEHLSRLYNIQAIDQSQVDQLLPRKAQASPSPHNMSSRLPKGIDLITLNKIRATLSDSDAFFSAEEVGNIIGASRTTARRYLEYMITIKEAQAQVSYGSVGRPERRYKPTI